MRGKNYDQRAGEVRLQKQRLLVLKAEAERSRFEAKLKGETPKVHCSFGISELDVFTSHAFTWDYWVKFPFKLLKDKEKFKQFNDKIQKAFEEIFLKKQKRN